MKSRAWKNLVHFLHRAVLHRALDHTVHGGTGYMGTRYASPCGYSIAQRVRPRRVLHEGWIIHSGMARRHGRAIPRKIRMGVSLVHCVHFLRQVQQTLTGIMVDGVLRTKAPGRMPIMTQHVFELKLSGSARSGSGRNICFPGH